MSIVDRAKNICLTPNTEWPVIAGESAQTGALITGYVLPLAAIGAVAGFIGRRSSACRSSAGRRWRRLSCQPSSASGHR